MPSPCRPARAGRITWHLLLAAFALAGTGCVLRPAHGKASTYLAYRSEPGDGLGQGASRRFTPSDGSFSVLLDAPGKLRVTFHSPGESWQLWMYAQDGAALTARTYENAMRAPFQKDGRPGLSFFGNGRGCNRAGGSFTIHDLAVVEDGTVSRLRASFRHRCEEAKPALEGEIAYVAPTRAP